jgi:hypothetical protein
MCTLSPYDTSVYNQPRNLSWFKQFNPTDCEAKYVPTATKRLQVMPFVSRVDANWAIPQCVPMRAGPRNCPSEMLGGGLPPNPWRWADAQGKPAKRAQAPINNFWPVEPLFARSAMCYNNRHCV